MEGEDSLCSDMLPDCVLDQFREGSHTDVLHHFSFVEFDRSCGYLQPEGNLLNQQA